LTSANIRRKGEAHPAIDAVSRGEVPTPLKTPAEALVPLSFKVPPEFKKRYQLAAIEAGLKLNEFLFTLLERHEAEKRKS
jgi:hypothetical protein